MKRFTICLLILAVIFSLAACHLDGADVSAPSGTEASTAATTEATVSTTEVTDAPIMGKVYVYDKEIEYASTPIARKIIIYEDGAFYSNQSIFSSSLPVSGSWVVEEGILILRYDQERVSHFQFTEERLTFIKGEQDLSSLRTMEDGSVFIYMGTVQRGENWSNTFQ